MFQKSVAVSKSVKASVFFEQSGSLMFFPTGPERESVANQFLKAMVQHMTNVPSLPLPVL